MKRQLLTALLCTACLTAMGAEVSDEVKALKKELKNKMKIGSITDKTIEKDNGDEVEQIRFYTYRTHGCTANFVLQATIELTDNRGKGDSVYAILYRPHHKPDIDFTGKEEWEFEIPHGGMKNPKITAYAIQSGIMHNKTFIPVAEELDDVDSADEIIERENTQEIEMECAKHASFYTGH